MFRSKYYIYKVDLSDCIRYYSDEIINDFCERLEKTYPNTTFLKVYLPDCFPRNILISDCALDCHTIPSLAHLLGIKKGRPTVFQVKLELANIGGYTKLEISRIISTKKYKLNKSGIIYRFGKNPKKIFQSTEKWVWMTAAQYL